MVGPSVWRAAKPGRPAAGAPQLNGIVPAKIIPAFFAAPEKPNAPEITSGASA
jgi:hypothetical protein